MLHMEWFLVGQMLKIDVDEIYRSHHSFSQEISRQVVALLHPSGLFNNIPILSFNSFVQLWSVGSCELSFDAYYLTVVRKIHVR